MTRPLLCAMLALAACSAEPQRNANAEADRQPSRAAIAVPASAPAARDIGAKPKPGVLKTFGDWTVGCDNTRRCELRSLLPEAESGGVTVSIAREAGPAGAITSSVSTDEQDGLTPSVDGKASDSSAAMVRQMVSGRLLAARAAARVVGTVSLKGAAAALRYLDAVQGRAGTVTALVAKGIKPASAVPPPAPVPTIVAAVPGGSPSTPPPGALAAMRKAAGCEDQPDAPEFHALGAGRTLVLLPCSSGAYNVSQAAFVFDGSRFAAAPSDAPVGFAGSTGASRGTTVVNGGWENGVLTSYAKGRGIGDCGVSQELVWDGMRLRLAKQREMGECRGNPDFITTWQAKVIRR